MNAEVETLHVFDWYDGIVLGVVTAKWDTRTYLASLVYWAPDKLQRVIALVPVASDNIKAIADYESLGLDVLIAKLRIFVSGYMGEVLLVYVDDRTNAITRREGVAIGTIRGALLGSVEDAISRAPFE